MCSRKGHPKRRIASRSTSDETLQAESDVECKSGTKYDVGGTMTMISDAMITRQIILYPLTFVRQVIYAQDEPRDYRKDQRRLKGRRVGHALWT